MKKSAIVIAALFATAGSASAQSHLAGAKNAAAKSVDATNAHTDAMQKPEAQAPAPKPVQSGKQLTQSVTKPGSQLDVAKTDTVGPAPTIYREVFGYARDGRRDPFVSLLTTNELRPTMSDLRLTGVLFDHSGRNSIATLRDLTNNAQYRVTVGSALGRMRVSAIRTLTVVFTIDEFGTTRRDSLTLRDSTNRARIR